MKAGISTRVKKNKKNTRETILECGKRTKYAPITADMAPEAPTIGTCEKGMKTKLTAAAKIPPAR